MVDETLLRKLLCDLVAIDSVNPVLVPGARGEAVAAEFLRDFLRHHQINASLQDAVAGRPNVVALLGASQSDHSIPRAALAILAHIDTVGAGDMLDPFTPFERDGRLIGRGALDIKSGVAAMCAAAISIVQEGTNFSRPLLLAAVVDEECDSAGTGALLHKYTADAAVVLEPTDLKLVIAHKGYAWYEITTHGRAAHGSLPAEGRDAIRMMGRVLVELEDAERFFVTRASHPLLGHASLHASLISGGQELSSYPAQCRLQLEFRTLPGQSEADASAELRRRLDNLRIVHPDCNATVRLLGARAPYEISADAPIASGTALTIREVTGNVELCGMAAWTDTALLSTAGIPGVVFGPSGRGMHGAEEYVDVESVTVCAEVLRRLILQMCCA